MAFCTECGKQLSDSAVFCPNCGHKRPVPGEAPEEQQRFAAEVRPKESPEDSGENAEIEPAPSAEDESDAAPAQTAEEEPAAETVETAYREPVNSTGYRESYGQNTCGNNSFGYKSHEEIEKKNNSKAAIIVIATVVVLLAVAVVLFITLSRSEDFVGYWEAEEVDLGDGFDDELFGHDVKGMFGLQLDEDHTYKLLSAFSDRIISGPWKETDSGIQLQSQMESVSLSYRNRQLLMQVGSYTFAFERSDGSIDDPTLPSGIYAGSGNALTDTPVTSPSDDPAPDGQNTPSVSPGISGSGYVGNGDYYISVVGAENFTDTEGDPAIRIYYEFTNCFDFPESAYNTIDWEAVQDGESLEFAYCWDDVDVYDNDLLNVRPGLTVQCCIQYKYNPNGGTVEASFFGWSEGKSGGRVVASYVPGQLPGAPAPYEYEPVPDPEWTISELESEGYLDSGKCYVEVTDAKLIQDSYGYDAVRVFYRFTNHYNEPVSFYEATMPVVYQDGIGLLESYAEVSSDTDDMVNTSISPGQTVEVSCVFRLRNKTSSIEAEVEGVETYAAVGQTYKIS